MSTFLNPAAATPVSVEINGQTCAATVDNRTLLIDLIRDQAGLTGTKRGCNEGKCGACTVLLDGRPVKSCNVLAARADGAKVQTVEGLAPPGELGPLQQAFHNRHGLQCGFCTGGMLMMAQHIVHSGVPNEPEAIREAIHGNICRCTGYQKIVEAIGEAIGNVRCATV
jgi:carbon-monoxide dehydrogenase small subunit